MNKGTLILLGIVAVAVAKSRNAAPAQAAITQAGATATDAADALAAQTDALSTTPSNITTSKTVTDPTTGNSAAVVIPAAPANVGTTVTATPTGGYGGGYTLSGPGGTYNVAYPPTTPSGAANTLTSADWPTAGVASQNAQLWAELQYYRSLGDPANNAIMSQISAQINANLGV